MDEFAAVLKAREFVNKVNPPKIPVCVKTYVEKIEAVLRRDSSLEPYEAGLSVPVKGKLNILVNANDSPERQRFTVCHEIAHAVLGLPSEHHNLPSWSYANRSPNEIFCDVFAAELLLPVRLFKPLVDRAQISLAAVDDFSTLAKASFTATGSRFATVVGAPCAFVLSEQGKVRYAPRSKALREENAWIAPRTSIPKESVAARVRDGGQCDGAEEVNADIWFDNWNRGGVLLEESRHLKQWDQTLSLLWFEDEEVPPPPRSIREQEEDTGLRELDGILPWPGKNRRR